MLFFYTRLIERKNLSALHAALHPNDRAVEPVIAARGAGSQFAREQMLAQSVPALRTPAEGIPD